MTSFQRDEKQIPATTDQLTIRVSRAALVAAVDAVLDHVLTYDFTECHNLSTLAAECSSEGCAAEMELLRVAQRHGVSIPERLDAVRALVAKRG